MSYEPSHRKPPRQERWPNATPGEDWPAYQHEDGGRAPGQMEAFAGSRSGREAAGGYGGPGQYEAPGGYDGRDGYVQPGYEFSGPAGHLAQEEYQEPTSVLVAPDTVGEWWRRPGRDPGRGRGAIVSVVTGLLATAVAIGVATLAAAFVGPQASPVSAVGGVLTDRIPATLRNHLMAHLGAHSQTLLLLGVLGLIAIALGCMARRNASIAVAGLAAFGMLGAFVAITRPASRPSDVIPSAIGGLAGIAALLWLVRASAPGPQAGYGDGRGRAR